MEKYVIEHGTLILAVLKRKSILLAADSKRLYHNQNGVSEGSVCKLAKKGNYWYAAFGETALRNVKTSEQRYDVADIIKNCDEKSDINQVFDHVCNTIQEKFPTEVFLNNGITNTELFKRFANFFFHIWVIGFVNGKPFLTHAKYFFMGTAENYDLSYKVESTVNAKMIEQFKVMPISSKFVRGIQNFAIINPSMPLDNNYVQRINSWMQESAQEHEDVGPPFRIVEISPDNSFKWVQNEC